jgi:phospholipid/cholesterol/gamma-HCH transport system substrate-binding protein
MTKQRKNEFLVGLTVLVGLLILLFAFSYFKEWNTGRGTYALTMRFPTSAGVQAGDIVTVNGVRAGKVEQVTIQRNAVLVRALLAEEFALSEDAHPVIQMLELMGGKKIEISQGVSNVPLDVTKELAGSVDPDIAGALALVGQLQGDVRSIAEKANRLLDNLNAVAGDSSMIAALKTTVRTLDVLARDMRRLVSENAGNANEIAGHVATLTHRADSLLAVFPPRVQRSLDRADRTLVGADSLVTDIRGVVTELRTGQGLVPRLLNDTTLARNVDRLLQKVDSLTDIINGGQLRIKIRL